MADNIPNNEFLGDELDKLNLRAKLQKEAQESLEGYGKLLKGISETQSNINFLTKNKLKFEEKHKELTEEIADLKRHGKSVDDDEVKVLIIKARQAKKALKDSEQQIKKQTDLLNIHKSSLELVKKRNILAKEGWKTLKHIGRTLLEQKGYLLEQQKAVKETELTMGVLSNQAGAFRHNIYKTSLSTTNIGIDTKELAKIQGTYSENVGRTLVLNEESLEAISEMAKGTILGAEGAAELAGNMENFGISAEASRDLVEDMVNRAHQMGVNAGKVVKTMQKNLGLAQKYHFKGGIKGLSRMAALTTKFKLEMESVAGFAEKIMSPEGAVEMAAKLQVLGGAWSKLGDPFELMFRSRNDIEGLTQDIIDAAQGTARFNEKTGEFKIDPMELHRLREVANVTGISAEELAKMAKEQAKFNKIRGQLSGRFDEENKNFIESLAQYNKDTGRFEVTYQSDGQTVTKSLQELNRLTNAEVSKIAKEKATLKERALQAQTFDDKMTNLINTFKATLLPGFESIASGLETVMTEVRKFLEDKNIINWLSETSKQIGDWIVEWPKLSAGIAGILLFGEEAFWLARGMMLGKGFNMTANPNGGDGLGGSLFGKNLTGKGSGLRGFKGNLGKTAGSAGAIGGGILSAGISGFNEWTSNKASGMGTSENIGRTGARASGAGLGAWGGAAAGAALGSVVPVIGTAIGGIIGGILGGMGGDKLGDMLGDSIWGKEHQDFISRPGSNPVSFSSKDTLIGAKKGGPIDKMLDSSSGVKPGSSQITVSFSKPLNITGKIELMSNGKSAEIDINDPILMRELSKVVQQELSKSIGGGKLSSNPVISN